MRLRCSEDKKLPQRLLAYRSNAVPAFFHSTPEFLSSQSWVVFLSLIGKKTCKPMQEVARTEKGP